MLWHEMMSRRNIDNSEALQASTPWNSATSGVCTQILDITILPSTPSIYLQLTLDTLCHSDLPLLALRVNRVQRCTMCWD